MKFTSIKTLAIFAAIAATAATPAAAWSYKDHPQERAAVKVCLVQAGLDGKVGFVEEAGKAPRIKNKAPITQEEAKKAEACVKAAFAKYHFAKAGEKVENF